MLDTILHGRPAWKSAPEIRFHFDSWIAASMLESPFYQEDKIVWAHVFLKYSVAQRANAAR